MQVERALAEGLAAEGVNVALCAREGARVMEQAGRIHAKYGVETMAVAADLTGAPKVLMLMPERSLDAEFFIQKEASVMIDLLGQAGFDVGGSGHKSIDETGTGDIQIDGRAVQMQPML